MYGPRGQLHAANAQVGVAVAAMLPQFSITGTLAAMQPNSLAVQQRWPFWTLVGGVTQLCSMAYAAAYQARASAALKQAAANIRAP